MTIKLFISYSHQDEAHKNSLEEHLSMLKRNNIIETWNDRKITAGNDWEKDIDDNLSQADVVLYLVSASFLSSDYCWKKEFESILAKHKEGNCLIIPIIVRACDWKTSPLGKIQGLPKDGKAISSWDDIDSAWENVVHGVRIAIDEFKKKSEERVVNNSVLSKSFSDFLDDTIIPFYNKGNNMVSFSDIYVLPDLIKLDSDLERKKIHISDIYKSGKFIIYGDEKSGKSSLLKWLFKEINREGRKAVYIDLASIRSLKNKDDVLNKTYENIYETSMNKECSIILDNFDKANELNEKTRKEFIEYINSKFNNIIISFDTDNSFLKEDLGCFNDYIEVKIKDFGFEKKEELIKKWYSIGVDETISDEELYKKIDDAKDKINSILLKNILPSKPVNILLILSLMESNGVVEFTSYGHCYQQLIYQSFDNVNIKKLEFDKYINILKEISWEFFKCGNKLNENGMSNFFKKYAAEYLSVDEKTIIKKMMDAHIISFDGVDYSFKYQYIYYFFIGKKISESYSDDLSVREKVDDIFNEIYKDDYAAILVFINYHNRDSWLTKRIIGILDDLFKEIEESSLDKNSLEFMKNFYEDIPQIIIDSKSDIQEARKRKNRELDTIEEKEKHKNLHDKEDEYDTPDLVKNIQALFKGIEIIGQITRSRHSSIKKGELLAIVRSGISAGLRFLNYFIQVSDVTKKRAVDYLNEVINKNNAITESELKRQVEYFYLLLVYKIIFIIIEKIALSVGSKEASEIYLSLSEEKNTVAMKLINEEILLNFSKSLDPSRIESLNNELSGNKIANLILQEVIVNYLEMFPVGYKDKQRIANILKISMKGINLISNINNRK